MATTGILNGTDLILKVAGTAVTHATSASINFNMETREATTKDSAGYTAVLEGLRSVTIDAEAMTALDAAYGFEELYTVWKNRTAVALVFGTTETGDQIYTVQGYMTSLSASSGVEDSSTFSASFQCTGAVTESNN
jgi:hypothetical protein